MITKLAKNIVFKPKKHIPGLQTTGTYKGKSNKPGGGGQFQQTVDAIMKSSPKGGIKEAKSIAALQGMKKYGKSKMQQFAQAGRKKAGK